MTPAREQEAVVKKAEIERRLCDFAAQCREQGIPLTVQRRDILRAVLQRDDHPTVEQIFEIVRERIPGLSLTTVYRVLETLCQLGMLRRLHHPGAMVRFDGRIERHHHLVCRLCDKVIDVESKKLDSLQLSAGQRQGFLVEDYAVHFHGVCRSCRQNLSD